MRQLTLAYSAQAAPDTVQGRPTCASCCADPDDMPGCNRCHGSGQDPNP